jgi:hypothetical protein
MLPRLASAPLERPTPPHPLSDSRPHNTCFFEIYVRYGLRRTHKYLKVHNIKSISSDLAFSSLTSSSLSIPKLPLVRPKEWSQNPSEVAHVAHVPHHSWHPPYRMYPINYMQRTRVWELGERNNFWQGYVDMGVLMGGTWPNMEVSQHDDSHRLASHVTMNWSRRQENTRKA